MRICKEADQSVIQNERKTRAAGMGFWVGLTMFGIFMGRSGGFWGGLAGAIIGSTIGGFVLHQILIQAALPYIRESLRKGKAEA